VLAWYGGDADSVVATQHLLGAIVGRRAVFLDVR
jgi:hypothetical protein